MVTARIYGAAAAVLFLALAAGTGCAPYADGKSSEGQTAGVEWFTDVTAEAGLASFRHETGAEGSKLFPESMGSGCGFIDYDGDGRLDILLAGGGTWLGSSRPAVPAVALYRNNGDGTFVDVTSEAGLDRFVAYSMGFAVADYDDDGDADFYLTTLAENLLFRNDGGVFTEVGAEAGVAGAPVWSTAAIFFDADGDGRLDLYVGNYVEWSLETDIYCTLDGEKKDYCTPQTYKGVPGRFYRNNGDGTFSDESENAGFLPARGKVLGVAAYDINDDNRPDLFVANDTEPDELFINRGDGTFDERGARFGIAYDENGRARAGMGIDIGVVDSTGEPTVFIGHFSRESIGAFRRYGSGLFVDRAAEAGIARPSLLTLTFGLFLFDVDLDGDLDLFAANGHVQPDIETVAENIRYAERPHLFLNRGNGTFEDAAPKMGGVFRQPMVARGAAYGDYDGDGDPDILITENGGGVRLWRNETNSSSYLRVHVIGRAGNRDALGTRITAVVNGIRLERTVRSGSSYLSASEQGVTFGLGPHDQVDSLIVRWPSGSVDRIGPTEGGRDLVVEEGSFSESVGSHP